MDPDLTHDAARAFADRWRIAAEQERAELQTATLEARLEQTAALMRSARELGWATTDPGEVEQVRARWLLIAERLLG